MIVCKMVRVLEVAKKKLERRQEFVISRGPSREMMEGNGGLECFH